MTLYGFVLRARSGTLFHVTSEGRHVLFDGSFSPYVKAELLDYLLGEWSAMAHRPVLGFAPACSNDIPYVEVVV